MIGTTQNQRGEFLRHNLNSPIQIRVGDTAVVVGNQLLITRDGRVVEVRTLGAESVVPLEATRDESIDHVLYFKERRMAGILSTMQSPIRNPDGSVLFSFTNGDQREFSSVENAIEQTDYIDTLGGLAQDILIRMVCKRSPDGTDLHQLVGATCGIDCLATQPVSVRID